VNATGAGETESDHKSAWAKELRRDEEREVKRRRE
jgi:hypothetical protein